jgi:hypothetical protein
LEDLKLEVGVVALGRSLGQGFFILRAQETKLVQAMLLLIPWRSRYGMCIFQRWMPGFDPYVERKGNQSVAPSGMKIPTWITLRKVPEEFIGVAEQIAQNIGDLLGVDAANNSFADQKFCIGLDGKGWEPSVTVKNKNTGKQYKILIDYNFLPIRCKFCLDTQHCVKDCPVRPASQPLWSGKQQNHHEERKTNQATQGAETQNRGVGRGQIAQRQDNASKEMEWTKVRNRKGRSRTRPGFKS